MAEQIKSHEKKLSGELQSTLDQGSGLISNGYREALVGLNGGNTVHEVDHPAIDSNAAKLFRTDVDQLNQEQQKQRLAILDFHVWNAAIERQKSENLKGASYHRVNIRVDSSPATIVEGLPVEGMIRAFQEVVDYCKIDKVSLQDIKQKYAALFPEVGTHNTKQQTIDFFKKKISVLKSASLPLNEYYKKGTESGRVDVTLLNRRRDSETEGVMTTHPLAEQTGNTVADIRRATASERTLGTQLIRERRVLIPTELDDTELPGPQMEAYKKKKKKQPKDREYLPAVIPKSKKTEPPVTLLVPNADNPPTPRKNLIGIVRSDVNIEKKAREIADAALRKAQKEKVWAGWKVWKTGGNILRQMGLRSLEDGNRHRVIEAAKAFMRAHGTTAIECVAITIKGIEFKILTEAEQRAAAESDTNAGHMVVELQNQKDAGEEVQGQEVAKAEGPLRDLIINTLIKPHLSSPTFDRTTFDREFKRNFVAMIRSAATYPTNPVSIQLLQMFGEDAVNGGERIGQLADSIAGNMGEVVEAMRADKAAHNFAVDDMTANTEIIFGNISWGAETKDTTKDGRVYKAMRAMGLRSPVIAGFAASLITTLAFKGITNTASKAATFLVPGAGSVAAGIVAALNRDRNLQRDMATHRREMAYGSKMPDTQVSAIEDKRRAELDKYKYDTKTADELLDIQSLLVGEMTSEVKNKVQQRIADIKSRLEYSALHGVDLIQYSSRESVQTQRMMLVRALAQLRKRYAEQGTNDTEKQETQSMIDANKAKFTKDKNEQDSGFKGYRRKESFKAAGRAAILGGVGGIISQELLQEVTVAWNDTAAKLIQNTTGINLHASLGKTTLETIADMRNAPYRDGLVNSAMDLRWGHHSGVDQVRRLFGPINHEQSIRFNSSEWFGTDTTNGFEIAQVPGDVTQVDVRHAGSTVRAMIMPDGRLQFPPGTDKALLASMDQHGFDIQQDITRGINKIDTHIGSVVSLFKIDGKEIKLPPGMEIKQGNGSTFDLMEGGKKIMTIAKDANGKLVGTPEPGQSLSNINIQETLGSSTKVAKDIWGPQGELSKHGEKLTRLAGYHNNTPGSNLNELRFNTYLSDKGEVILSSARMTNDGSFADGLGKITDVQQMMNTKGGFAFFRPGSDSPVIAMPNHSNGMALRLDIHAPDTEMVRLSDGSSMKLNEFSKMILNEQSLAKLPVPTAGKMTDIATEFHNRQDLFDLGRDGSKTGLIAIVERTAPGEINTLAQIRGTGLGNTIEIATEKPGDLSLSFDRTVTTEGAITAGIPPREYVEPIIPFSPLPPGVLGQEALIVSNRHPIGEVITSKNHKRSTDDQPRTTPPERGSYIVIERVVKDGDKETRNPLYIQMPKTAGKMETYTTGEGGTVQENTKEAVSDLDGNNRKVDLGTNRPNLVVLQGPNSESTPAIYSIDDKGNLHILPPDGEAYRTASAAIAKSKEKLAKPPEPAKTAVSAEAQVEVSTNAKKFEYSTLEAGKPIESNIFNAPEVRFIPDIHGGSDATKQKGQRPLEPFMAGMKPGEVAISVGDVADRGPQSFEAAWDLKEKVEKGEAVHVLGNHDMFAIASVNKDPNNKGRDRIAFANWLLNGGAETIQGAGIDIKGVIEQEKAKYNETIDDPDQQFGLVLGDLARGKCPKLDAILVQVQDKSGKLCQWAESMQKHGKLYVIANGGLGIHAGVPVNQDGSLLKQSVGSRSDLTGLDYLDAVQDQIRSGNYDEIYKLFDGDAHRRANPVWVREPYQETVAEPNAASKMREQINAQAQARGAHVEFFVHGHDKHKAGTEFKTAKSPEKRGFFIDIAHFEGGDPGILRVKLDKSGENIDVSYVDPNTGTSPKNKDGTTITMNQKYTVARPSGTEAAQVAPSSPEQLHRIVFGKEKWLAGERPTGYFSITASMDKLKALNERHKIYSGSATEYLKSKYAGKEEATNIDAFWKLVHQAKTTGLTQPEVAKIAELSVKVNQIITQEIINLRRKNETPQTAKPVEAGSPEIKILIPTPEQLSQAANIVFLKYINSNLSQYSPKMEKAPGVTWQNNQLVISATVVVSHFMIGQANVNLKLGISISAAGSLHIANVMASSEDSVVNSFLGNAKSALEKIDVDAEIKTALPSVMNTTKSIKSFSGDGGGLRVHFKD